MTIIPPSSDGLAQPRPDAFDSEQQLQADAAARRLSPEFRSIMHCAATEPEDAGYTVSRTPVPVGAGSSANLIAHLPGSGTDTRDLVLATVHLDSVDEAGRSLPAPGADDNASGSAGVLELGTVLAGHLEAAGDGPLVNAEEAGAAHWSA